jgi:hypothetical protein
MYYSKYEKYKNKNLQYGGTTYIIDDKICNPNNKRQFVDYVMSCPQIKTINETIFYYSTLLISGMKYDCLVLLKQLQTFDIFFIDTSYDFNKKDLTNNNIYDNSYIILNFSNSDKVSTRFNFPVIEGKNKLETILEILDNLYFHFCYDKIVLLDIAEFSCSISGLPIVEYNAILYRIFYTDKSLNEISIYTRVGYNYKNDCSQVELDFLRNYNVLDFLRNYNVSDFRDFLMTVRFYNGEVNTARINLIQKLKPYIGYSLHYFFKNSNDAKLNIPQDCYKNYMFLKILESIKRGNFRHPFAETLKNFCACVSNLEKTR